MLQHAPTVVVLSHSSYDDEKAFEQVWQPKDCDWIAAQVHRYEGLTLIYEMSGCPYGVRFAYSLCGYVGNGPSATAKILSQAGFGDYEELLAKVSEPGNDFIALSR